MSITNMHQELNALATMTACSQLQNSAMPHLPAQHYEGHTLLESGVEQAWLAANHVCTGAYARQHPLLLPRSCIRRHILPCPAWNRPLLTDLSADQTIVPTLAGF